MCTIYFLLYLCFYSFHFSHLPPCFSLFLPLPFHISLSSLSPLLTEFIARTYLTLSCRSETATDGVSHDLTKFLKPDLKLRATQAELLSCKWVGVTCLSCDIYMYHVHMMHDTYECLYMVSENCCCPCSIPLTSCFRPEPIVPQGESETVDWDPEEAIVVSICVIHIHVHVQTHIYFIQSLLCVHSRLPHTPYYTYMYDHRSIGATGCQWINVRINI